MSLSIKLRQRSLIKGRLHLAGSPADGIAIRIADRIRRHDDESLPEVLAVTATDESGAFAVSVPVEHARTVVLEPLAPAGYAGFQTKQLTLGIARTTDVGIIELLRE